MINSNTHSQTGVWERGRSPVGGDCYRTIDITFKIKFQSLFMPIVGAMAIAPYGVQSLSARFLFMRILFDGRLKPYPTNFKLLNQKSLTMSDQFNPTTKRVP